jgi:TolB protein
MRIAPSPARTRRARFAVRLAVALCLATLGVGSLPGKAQEDPSSDELTGVIRGEASARLSMAVPPTVAGPSVKLSAAAEIGQVLRSDLDFSGWFGLLAPEGEGRIPSDKLGDPGAWGRVGAAYLVVTRLERSGERALFDVELIETGGGSTLWRKRWGGRLPDDLRRLAHVAADEIVESLTGSPGIAQTRIAFTSRLGEGKEVYLMDYDGARVRRLTSTGTINLAPAWSPDGRRLTFLSFLGDKPSIYLLSEDGEVTTLRPEGGELNAAPDFSPAAEELVFSSDRSGNSELYLYDLTTHRQRRLTFNPGIDTAPCWSPSGNQIAFTSDRSGSPQIYLMNRDGSGVRRLTWEGRYNESAAWSPDGGRIAFVSRIKGRFEIVVHDLGSGSEKIITSGPGNKENPRWAPDGRHLVFSSDRTGIYSIYTIRDDGTELRRLTRGRPAWTPDWSPVRK